MYYVIGIVMHVSAYQALSMGRHATSGKTVMRDLVAISLFEGIDHQALGI